MKQYKTHLFLVLVTVIGLTQPAPAPAQAAAQTGRFTFSEDELLFVSCANGGLGEFIRILGQVEVLLHSTDNGNNSLRIRMLRRHSILGVGLTTGDVYHSFGITRETVVSRGDGGSLVNTTLSNFRFIGPGPGNNFLARRVLHFIVTDDEVKVTANHFFSADCQ